MTLDIQNKISILFFKQPEHYDVIYDWRDFADNYQKEKGGEKRILMTEAYTKSTNLPLYYNSPDNKRQGCEIPFNFMFIMDLGKTATVDEFKKGVDHLLSLVPKGKYMNWVIGNHDRARVGSRFGPQRIDGMLMLAMTLPGIAVTYYVSSTYKSYTLEIKSFKT